MKLIEKTHYNGRTLWSLYNGDDEIAGVYSKEMAEYIVKACNAYYENISTIKDQKNMIALQEKTIDQLVELLEKAHCPDCGGYETVYDGQGNEHTCEWCYKRKNLLSKLKGE